MERNGKDYFHGKTINISNIVVKAHDAAGITCIKGTEFIKTEALFELASPPSTSDWLNDELDSPADVRGLFKLNGGNTFCLDVSLS